MPYKDPAKQREFQARWIRERREQWITEQGGVCSNCGGVDRLQVDHIDPMDKATHRIWSFSAERRARELAKCRVLCHECHNEVSSNAHKLYPRGYRGAKRATRLELATSTLATWRSTN
jgi:5-methylcytosine-specific restriction endonuclease McrA